MAGNVTTGIRESARGARSRGTTQRAAMLEALGTSGRFRTAQDIYAELRVAGTRIGLTTVYRHLQKLADDGTIHAVQTAGRQTAYRLCGDHSPHHHLICTSCGVGIEITGSAMDSWVEVEAARRGYSDVTHSLEIFGLCPECSGRQG